MDTFQSLHITSFSSISHCSKSKYWPLKLFNMETLVHSLDVHFGWQRAQNFLLFSPNTSKVKYLVIPHSLFTSNIQFPLCVVCFIALSLIYSKQIFGVYMQIGGQGWVGLRGVWGLSRWGLIKTGFQGLLNSAKKRKVKETFLGGQVQGWSLG